MPAKKKRSRKTRSQPARPIELTQAEVDQMVYGKAPPKSVVQRIRRSRPSRGIGRLDAKDKEQPIAITRAEMTSIARRGGPGKAVQARIIKSVAPEEAAPRARSKRTAYAKKRPRKKPPLSE